MPMKILRLLALAIAGTSLYGSFANAQTVATDPVGFLQPFEAPSPAPSVPNLLANADTPVSIPFTRPPEFVGSISSVSGNTITVSGTPWTANQFVFNPAGSPAQHNHYYALIGPGTSNPKDGHAYPITANGTNTLTVDTTQDNLTGIPASSQVLVIPNWTLGTVFPASDANVSYTPTTATRTFKTQIFIPNYSAPGINQAFSTIYFYSNNVNNSTNNVGWRVFGDNTTSHDDDPLLPDGYFVVRNQNGAPAGTLTTLGSVLTKKFAIPLVTSATAQQDNSVAMIRPVDVALSDTGLNTADGSFVATTATRNFGDQLLLLNPPVSNKPAVTIYFYSNNVNNTTNNVGWRIFGDNTTPHDGDLIPAGSAIIIRKAKTANGATVYWNNAPTY